MKKDIEDYNVFWFRRDLRLDDNVGLHHSLSAKHPTLCIYIFDRNDKSTNPKQTQFIFNCLLNLKQQLNELGSDLIVFHASIESAWGNIFSNFNANAIYANEEYEKSTILRDKKVLKLCKSKSIEFNLSKDQCIFSAHEVLKDNGKPYTVFTPYKNKWLKTLRSSNYKSVNNKALFANFAKLKPQKLIDINDLLTDKTTLTSPERRIPIKIIKNYDNTRDIPALKGTSNLSSHLRFGTISIRKCVQIAINNNKTWLSELIWREFFMQILFNFPNVQRHPFKEKYNSIPWRNQKAEFEKWKTGTTGYPIVDAGMRELNETGLMHNRVRMITASFLVKHLLIDWRWGEKYFAQKLLDYELSSNNGNWQWVAGTGCDSAPYFRIFNPETQTKKFDSDFKYINKWVKEYDTPNYPPPMVDHKYAYKRAIATYQKALNSIRALNQYGGPQ